MIQKISILKNSKLFLINSSLYSTKLSSKADENGASSVTKGKNQSQYIGPKDFNIQSFLLKQTLINGSQTIDSSKYFEKETNYFVKNAVVAEFYNYPFNESLHKKHENYLYEVARINVGQDLKRFEHSVKKEEKEKQRDLRLQKKSENKVTKKIQKTKEKPPQEEPKNVSKIEEKKISKEAAKSTNEFTLDAETRQIVQKNLKNATNPVQETKNEIQVEKQELRKILIAKNIEERKKKINRYQKFLNSNKMDEKFLLNSLDQVPFLSSDLILQNKSLYTPNEICLSKTKLFDFENLKINENNSMPSVSNIIELAYPLSENLLKWQVEKAQTLGLDGFKAYSDLIKKEGQKFHTFIENRLMNKPSEKYDPNLEALDSVFSDIDQVKLIESPVVHSNLFYHGRIDCLAYYKGELCLIDWKCSEKSKTDFKDLYDLPIQISAYIGAFLNDPSYESLRKDHHLKKGLLVNYNKTNGDVNVHLINYQLAEYYWYKWATYLRKFWIEIKKSQ